MSIPKPGLTGRDYAGLNYLWLMTARNLAQHDIATAIADFELDPRLAVRIATMTEEAIRELAEVDQMLMKPKNLAALNMAATAIAADIPAEAVDSLRVAATMGTIDIDLGSDAAVGLDLKLDK